MFNPNDKNTFYLVPKEALDELIEAVKAIKHLQDELNKKDETDALGDFIEEKRAMELLKRGKTWFWEKRKTGELPGKKAAGRWYYRKEDIKKLIIDGK